MSMATKNEYWENEAAKNSRKERAVINYATVVALAPSGEPVIRFVGEREPSKKTFVRLKSYMPEVGDWVLLIGDIIIGGWRVA